MLVSSLKSLSKWKEEYLAEADTQPEQDTNPTWKNTTIRYYWTNIRVREDWTGQRWTDIPQPKDKKINFKDIITDGYVEFKKARCLLESEERILINKSKLYRRYKKIPMINIVFDNYSCKYSEKIRILNQIELERLQGFPDGWTSILNRKQAASLLGDGWTLPVIEHIF